MTAKRYKNLKADSWRAQRLSWAVIIAITLFGLSPVAGVNYIVDNHNLLRNQTQSDELIDYVANLRSAPSGVLYTYNDRSVKLLIAQQSQAECLVIGASHVMTLRRSNNSILGLECASLDNVGVAGASFEDVITFLGIALKNPKVKKVVLGVSLWTLKRNSRLNWMRNAREMLEARVDFGLSSIPYNDMFFAESKSWFERLLSLKYLRVNYKFLKRTLAGKTTLTYDPRPLRETELKQVMALRSDASLSYPEEFRPTPSNEELGTTDQWVTFPYVEEDVLREFTVVFDILQKAGKKIILYQAPYHPYIVETCPKENICNAIPRVTTAVQMLAKKLQLPIIGGYLPQAFGLDGDDFIDFQHLRGASSEKLKLQPMQQ